MSAHFQYIDAAFEKVDALVLAISQNPKNRYRGPEEQLADAVFQVRSRIRTYVNEVALVQEHLVQRIFSLGKVLDDLVSGGLQVMDAQTHRRVPGYIVYALYEDDNPHPVYFGKSESLWARLSAHHGKSDKQVKEWDFWRCVAVESEQAMSALEAELIHRFPTKYNKDKPKRPDLSLPKEFWDQWIFQGEYAIRMIAA